jgi:hypothetical protein
MNNEKCYYNLNIDCENAINKNWQFPSTLPENLNENQMFYISTYRLFDIDWLKNMSNIGLEFSLSTLLFYKRPYQKNVDAHVDFSPNGKQSVCGLNLIFGGKNAYMIWYKDPEKKNKPKHTAVGSTYLSYYVEELEEIERYILPEKKLTLVKTGIPHSIEAGEHERWCFSLRFKNMESKVPKFNEWNEVVDFMRSKNLLIER